MKVKVKQLIQKHIIDDLDNEGLTEGKEYPVIGIEGDLYRVIDDNNEPILYAKKLFDIVDQSLPTEWIKTTFDGEDYIEPPETSGSGFYEDYFDGVSYAITTYNDLLLKLGIKTK